MAAVAGDEPVIVPDAVLSGFLRIVTGSRVFQIAEPMADALGFLRQLLRAPAVSIGHAGAGHWDVFSGLCERTGVRAGLVSDAFLAAMAIEVGATLVTFDGDFARFPGLTWRHTLGGQTLTNPG